MSLVPALVLTMALGAGGAAGQTQRPAPALVACSFRDDPQDDPSAEGDRPHGQFYVHAGAWYCPPVTLLTDAGVAIQEAVSVRGPGSPQEQLVTVFDLHLELALSRGARAFGGRGGLGSFVVVHVPVGGGVALNVGATASARAPVVFREIARHFGSKQEQP